MNRASLFSLRRSPLNRTETLLAAIVVLFGFQTLRNSGLAGPREASAQVGGMSDAGADPSTRRESEAATFINPAKQRDQMIVELRRINERLRSVESELAKGLRVQEAPESESR